MDDRADISLTFSAIMVFLFEILPIEVGMLHPLLTTNHFGIAIALKLLILTIILTPFFVSLKLTGFSCVFRRKRAWIVVFVVCMMLVANIFMFQQFLD